MTTNGTLDSVDRIAELARQGTGVSIATVTLPVPVPGLPDSIAIALTHEEHPKPLDLKPLFENYRTRPVRARGTALVSTVESFCALVERNMTAETVIFACTNWTAPTLTAVLDYHAASDQQTMAAGVPGNGQHRVHYAFPLSESWSAWVEMNDEVMEQAEFAAWLEDHIAELSSPTAEEARHYESQFATTVATPAQVMELSRGLQVNVAATVKNAQTLQTGEASIQFEETHHDASGKPLKVPGLFILQTEIFFMGTPVRMPVRLRYRPAGGRIKWFFQIWRPDLHVTERIRADLDVIRDQLPGVPVYEGAPEMTHTGTPVPQPEPASVKSSPN